MVPFMSSKTAEVMKMTVVQYLHLDETLGSQVIAT